MDKGNDADEIHVNFKGITMGGIEICIQISDSQHF